MKPDGKMLETVDQLASEPPAGGPEFLHAADSARTGAHLEGMLTRIQRRQGTREEVGLTLIRPALFAVGAVAGRKRRSSKRRSKRARKVFS